MANKEVLVMAGRLVTDARARKCGVTILPIDSEHNAIHQCLHGRSRENPDCFSRLQVVRSAIIGRSNTSIRKPALQHPTWQMGKKITIDSATLMNKGLEVIEAHWLFGVTADQIDVVIHPQSIVHSMVELV